MDGDKDYVTIEQDKNYRWVIEYMEEGGGYLLERDLIMLNDVQRIGSGVGN